MNDTAADRADDPQGALRVAALRISSSIAALQDRADREMLAARRSVEEKALELASSLSLLSATLESSPDGVVAVDLSGSLLVWNRRFLSIWGIPPELMVQRDSTALHRWISKQTRDPEAFDRRIEQLKRHPDAEEVDIVELADGRTFERYCSPQRVDETCVGIVVNWRNITEKRHYEALIWQQANFDPLTSLPNRRMLQVRLVHELRQAQLNGTKVALLFIDLDHFKEVNDALGHVTGDQLIREAAARLRRCVREADTVARVGGDEFTVIIGNIVDPAIVACVAEEILRLLKEPFLLDTGTAHLSASIGITFFPEDADSIDQLLRHADQAMYYAKKKGRNRFHYFTPSMEEAAQSRMRLINDLRGAIAGNELRLSYQPIIHLRTGAVVKAEALIRWVHPRRGLISPAEFVPVAEDTGMIVEIGRWVLHEAIARAARWRASHDPHFQITVNISPVQFADLRGFETAVFDQLRDSGLDGGSIVMEITERLLLVDSGDVAERLRALRSAGMQVALDDFGTGYSSLGYLQRFEIDYVKIDQSFVRDLETSAGNRALCQAIIVMAHALGIKVVAEGIETPGQCDLLLAAGCDFGQGYHFSRPVDVAAFERLFPATRLPVAGDGSQAGQREAPGRD